MPPTESTEQAPGRWQRLESLLGAAESDIRVLGADELRELARLYRLSSLDLARYQQRRTPGPVIPYLNGLVLRGQRVIYSRQRAVIRWRGLWDLLALDFPRTLMAERRLFAITSLWFALCAVGGYTAMAHDPAWMRSLFPELFALFEMEGYGSQIDPSALASGNITPGTNAKASAYIAANNIRVSILAYGLGAALGVGTLYLLAMNGALLGAVSWFYLGRDTRFQEYFYAGILPHGVWELTAIAISATAGLMLARAVLFPGDAHRSAALRQAALRTLPLVGGVIFMLLVAGVIEGYVTPAAISSEAKVLTGLGSGGLFVLYVLIAGRPKTQPTGSAS